MKGRQLFEISAQSGNFLNEPRISNIFSLETDNLNPDCPRKNEKVKSFGYLSSPSKKTRLGSLHLEKKNFED